MNKVIGISSGRHKKVTEKAVRTVLSGTNLETQFYSLSNFEILTCDACNGCIKDYKCIKNDDLEEIKKDIKEAQGIVFGAPEYWGGMHAKGRAFWEKICFSLRHKDNFPLKEMPGVAIGVSGDGDSSGVLKDVSEFFSDLHIELVEKVEVQGEYACFNCGYGMKCEEGGLAEIYDIPIEMTENIIPTLDCQHPEKENTYNIREQLKDAGLRLTNEINNSI